MPFPNNRLLRQEAVLAAHVRQLASVVCAMRGLDPAAVLRAAQFDDASVPNALIPLKQAALLIGCSPKSLYNKASSGIDPLPVVKIGSRSMVRTTDLIDYIASHRVRSTSEIRRMSRG